MEAVSGCTAGMSLESVWLLKANGRVHVAVVTVCRIHVTIGTRKSLLCSVCIFHCERLQWVIDLESSKSRICNLSDLRGQFLPMQLERCLAIGQTLGSKFFEYPAGLACSESSLLIWWNFGIDIRCGTGAFILPTAP